jgi:hypothetical protein
VIGPVEPDLLRAFVQHYRGHGVREFLFAFHFTEHVPKQRREELVFTCEELVGPPVLISRGPWHETVHSELREHLRLRAGEGWHSIADIDEFHDYPAPPEELIAAAEAVYSPVVGGVMLDRVAADGSITGWHPQKGLDASFPLGGFLTYTLLDANPCKIVMAHSSVRLALGSHRSPDHEPVNEPLVPVHHFKWRDGIQEDLARRVSEHGSGAWRESSPAIRTEAAILLAHLEEYGGRVDIADPRLKFRPARLGTLPENWHEDSKAIADYIRQFFENSPLPEVY